MVRLSSFPDLSRFVKREDKVKVNNTVHLLVGEDSIEVSGLVLSQASQVLQDLVGNQRELYLDQFSGEIEGIQDVVEMLYGGEIELSEVNYQTIIKFSTVFQVKEMYQLCIEWVKVNILTLDLFSLINFGLLIEQVGQDNPDVLELCVGFIRDDVGDGLSEISKSWVIGSNTNFVKFLVHKDIFYFTLPILSEWITAYSSDTSVNLILTELEDKDLVEFFWKYGDRSTDLLKRLNENVEAITTSKRLTGFNIVNHKNCMMVGVDKSKLLCPEFVEIAEHPNISAQAVPEQQQGPPRGGMRGEGRGGGHPLLLLRNINYEEQHSTRDNVRDNNGYRHTRPEGMGMRRSSPRPHQQFQRPPPPSNR